MYEPHILLQSILDGTLRLILCSVSSLYVFSYMLVSSQVCCIDHILSMYWPAELLGRNNIVSATLHVLAVTTEAG